MDITESIDGMPAKNSKVSAFGSGRAEKLSGEYVREHILVDDPTCAADRIS